MNCIRMLILTSGLRKGSGTLDADVGRAMHISYITRMEIIRLVKRR